MWFVSNKYQVLFFIVLTTTYDIAKCDAISNTNFNSHIRDYSAVADINVSQEINTESNNAKEQNILTKFIFISEHNKRENVTERGFRKICNLYSSQQPNQIQGGNSKN